VHAYLITAMPTWRQRALRATGHYTARTLITAAMLLLGLVVFALRTCRALTNLAATVAARAEFAAADWAGTPPIGSVIGVGLADAFTDEFHRTYDQAAA
jgi:hypothetical protein